MWTLPDVRYERMHGKKPNEDKQWPLFKERQQYEVNERNSAELLSNESYYDFILQNNGDREILQARSETIVDAIVNGDKTCYLRNNPFPSQDAEIVKQYV